MLADGGVGGVGAAVPGRRRVGRRDTCARLGHLPRLGRGRPDRGHRLRAGRDDLRGRHERRGAGVAAAGREAPPARPARRGVDVRLRVRRAPRPRRAQAPGRGPVRQGDRQAYHRGGQRRGRLRRRLRRAGHRAGAGAAGRPAAPRDVRPAEAPASRPGHRARRTLQRQPFQSRRRRPRRALRGSAVGRPGEAGVRHAAGGLAERVVRARGASGGLVAAGGDRAAAGRRRGRLPRRWLLPHARRRRPPHAGGLLPRAGPPQPAVAGPEGPPLEEGPLPASGGSRPGRPVRPAGEQGASPDRLRRRLEACVHRADPRPAPPRRRRGQRLRRRMVPQPHVLRAVVVPLPAEAQRRRRGDRQGLHARPDVRPGRAAARARLRRGHPNRRRRRRRQPARQRHRRRRKQRPPPGPARLRQTRTDRRRPGTGAEGHHPADGRKETVRPEGHGLGLSRPDAVLGSGHPRGRQDLRAAGRQPRGGQRPAAAAVGARPRRVGGPAGVGGGPGGLAGRSGGGGRPAHERLPLHAGRLARRRVGQLPAGVREGLRAGVLHQPAGCRPVGGGPPRLALRDGRIGQVRQGARPKRPVRPPAGRAGRLPRGRRLSGERTCHGRRPAGGNRRADRAGPQGRLLAGVRGRGGPGPGRSAGLRPPQAPPFSLRHLRRRRPDLRRPRRAGVLPVHRRPLHRLGLRERHEVVRRRAPARRAAVRPGRPAAGLRRGERPGHARALPVLVEGEVRRPPGLAAEAQGRRTPQGDGRSPGRDRRALQGPPRRLGRQQRDARRVVVQAGPGRGDPSVDVQAGPRAGRRGRALRQRVRPAGTR